MSELVDLIPIVRRVVAARLDGSDRDDVVQEVLSALARRGLEGLAPEEQRAYAIVGARNAVASHHRRRAASARHERPISTPPADDPETLVLLDEQRAAVREALDRVDPGDRRLLVEHEVEGVAASDLAAHEGISPGAIGMRLARARAALRVEFLVAYQGRPLPSDRCRQVLQAVSAGDRRRQRGLDADGHLASCDVCADLAPPMRERRRGLAAWVGLPLVEAIRTVRGVLARHRRGAISVAVAIAAMAAGVTWRLTTAGAAEDDATPASVGVTAAAGETASPAATSSTAAATTVSARPPCPAAVEVDRAAGMPLGCPVAPSIITAVDVAADEGFWAVTAAGATVWVHLEAAGESPIQIEAGHHYRVEGRLGDAASAAAPDDGRVGVAAAFLIVPAAAVVEA